MWELDWTLLNRYLAGEATPEERVRFEAWRDASPARRTLVDSLLQATGAPSEVPLVTERERSATWARLEQSITSATVQEPVQARTRRPVPRFALPAQRWPLARVAAAVLLIGGTAAGGAIWWANRAGPARNIADVADAGVRVLQAARGQRATFQLPDGTRVMLGPESKLYYATGYGRRSREVRLEGEAYFSVLHDAQRPFVVRAADIVAQDLGTEFVVRAYPEQSHAIVTVRQGEVGIRAVTAADETVRVLTPGQRGTLSSAGEPVVETVALDPYFAWTEGRLVFDGTPLRDALPQLGRWFDLDLQLADTALGRIPVTATLDQRPTPEVLSNVAAALGLTLTYYEPHTATFRRPQAGR